MFSGIENERLLSINPIIKTSEFDIFLIWHLASMTRETIELKPLIVAGIIALLIVITTSNYTLPQLLAHKKQDNNKQPQHQQEFTKCVNKSLDKILNSFLNFSDPDPVSHCFDQPFNGKLNNGNGTQNNGGSIMDNSTFSNV